jgi:murein DD-endopeptidase MepM/ murein hydrolase activator NlpD
MSLSRNSDDGVQELRPLPSVDMALLPGDRRAAKYKVFALSSFSALFIAGLALATVFWPDLNQSLKSTNVALPRAAALQKVENTSVTHNQTPTESVLETALPNPKSDPGQARRETEALAATEALSANLEAPPAFGDEILRGGNGDQRVGDQIKRKFGRSAGFRGALLAAGLTRQEASTITAAFKNLVDFRRCRPEHDLVYERDIKGQLTRFEYRLGLLEIYRAERDRHGALNGRKLVIPVDKQRIGKGGHVSSSLGQSLDEVGLGKSFAGVFVGAFEGHLDFRRDARTGDSFKVLVDGEYLRGTFLRYGTAYALEYTSERKGTQRAFWYLPKNDKGDYYDAKGYSMQGGWLKTPLRYDYISSRYDLKRKHPLLKRVMPHQGIDYAASPGTEVRAAADGVVTFAGDKGPNGKLIVIRHQGGYESCYAHLSRIARGITPRVRIKQRQYIGNVGSSGLSTGPHLHFALRSRGKFIDPATELNGPGKPLPASEMARFRIVAENLTYELNRIRLSPAPTNIGAPLPSQRPDVPIEGTETL